MPRYAWVEEHIDVRSFLAWAVPVKVETLKAGLRAYIQGEDIRAAVQCNPDLPTLPVEVVDMVMAPIADDLHAKLLEQWTRLYDCSIAETPRVSIGTVCRRACQMGNSGRLRSTLAEYSEQDCGYCAPQAKERLWRDLAGKLERGEDATKLEYLLLCAPCRILHRRLTNTSPRACPPALVQSDGEAYEDDLVDLTDPLAAHPHGYALTEDLQDEMQFGWATGWARQAIKSIAGDWYTAVKKKTLFTVREKQVLAGFGVECHLVYEHCKGSRHTSALLIPADRETSVGLVTLVAGAKRLKRQGGATALGLPALRPEYELAVQRVIKKLRLEVCSDVNRSLHDHRRGPAERPQLVLIMNASQTGCESRFD